MKQMYLIIQYIVGGIATGRNELIKLFESTIIWHTFLVGYKLKKT